MARREWADNKVSSAQRRWSGLNMIEIAEEVLLAEHARAVRIVKGLRTRMYKSHCEESSQFCIGYQQAIDDLLAALTKGRA